MAPPNQDFNDRRERLMTWCRWLNALPNKLLDKVVEIAKEAKKIAKDDPRKIAYSLKVGLALTLVSLFYYYSSQSSFGVNAMWAVLTVVVVFEFSVGATLGKGFNRMIATLVAGGLAIGAHRLAILTGHIGEPILIAIFVFVIASVTTFARFFPALKARYDYGLSIFILTYCLVSVSGYTENEVIDMAHLRVSTIVIGTFIAISVCICICPVWIGQDLHNLVLGNVENLGNFLQGFGNEYFKVFEDEESNNDKSFLQKYKSALTSKNSEEAMADLAQWEPCHGRFRFFHPWKQYLKIGTLARECAYKIEALNTHLNLEIQIISKEVKNKFGEPCTKVGLECGKALKELASATKKMKISNTAAIQIANAKAEAENIKFLLKIKLWEEVVLADLVSIAAVAALLLEVVESTEKISEAINELALKAHFMNIDPAVSPEQPHLLRQGTVNPMPNLDATSHVVTIKGW